MQCHVETGPQIEAENLLITLGDQQIDTELVRLQAARADLLAASDTDQVSGEYLLKQKKLALEAVAQGAGFAKGEIADVVFPSGKVIKGRVQYNPRITGRLPAYLATPMLGRQRMVIVHLTPLEPIPPEESIDGLPVDVNFISFARQFIERVKNIFVPFS